MSNDDTDRRMGREPYPGLSMEALRRKAQQEEESDAPEEDD